MSFLPALSPSPGPTRKWSPPIPKPLRKGTLLLPLPPPHPVLGDVICPQAAISPSGPDS